MKRALPWIVGGLLVVAAGAVTAAIPSTVDQRAAFIVAGGADEPVTSRTLTAAVLDAAFTERVTVADSEWSADGNWLIVTLVASAPQTEVDAGIHLATLEIDGRAFHASERPGTSLVGTDLHVGTDTVGTMAFELPDDIRGGEGELRLTTEYFTPRLDDVVALRLSLDGLPTTPSFEIEEPQLGAP